MVLENYLRNQVKFLLVLTWYEFLIWHDTITDSSRLKLSVNVINLSSLSVSQHHKVLGVNLRRLTLLSPPCSCCSLSACQNNEGKKNTAFGPQQGQPAHRPHEYSVLHMVPRIRICIHLKALIRTLASKRSDCSCCQRVSWAEVVVFSLLERVREGQGGSSLEMDYLSVDWPVTKHWGAFIWEGERKSCHIMPGITEL